MRQLGHGRCNPHNEDMVRAFSKDDLGMLCRMICDTIDFSYSRIYPPRAVQWFKDHHTEKKIMERNMEGDILVIEIGGPIVATGSLVGNKIKGVFVNPDCQGQVYGKMIMTKLENMAKAKGLVEIQLSVSSPSRGFYEKLGYEVLAERSLDMGEGQRLDYWPGRKNLA